MLWAALATAAPQSLRGTLRALSLWRLRPAAFPGTRRAWIHNQGSCVRADWSEGKTLAQGGTTVPEAALPSAWFQEMGVSPGVPALPTALW